MEEMKVIFRRLALLRTFFYYIEFKILKKRIPNHIRRKNDVAIQKMKRVYKGKRCFIVGNGPSLKTEDLELLKKEITFGSNGIFHLYGRTEWRPTFYFVQDSIAYHKMLPNADEILSTSKAVFTSMNFYNKMPYKFVTHPNTRLLYVRFVPPKKSRYRFSTELSKCVYEGLSVTYSMILAAVYMGFTEIYLLGVDHNYSVEVDANGKLLKQDNTVKNHFYVLKEEEKGEMAGYPTKINEITNAFYSAKEYAKSHNILIKNVTRGGKLELFGRKNLEDIL